MALINVPNPGQTLGNSRNQVNTNFQVISTAFAIDHVAYSDSGGGQGKHNKVTFPRIAIPAVPAANEIRIVNALDALTAVSQLFLQRPAGTPYAFTAGAQTAAGDANSVGARGYAILPCGLVMKWGSDKTNGANVINLNGWGPALQLNQKPYLVLGSLVTAPATIATVSTLAGANPAIIVGTNVLAQYWFMAISPLA